MTDRQPCVQTCECPGFEDLVAVILFPVVAYNVPWGNTVLTALSTGALKFALYSFTALLMVLALAHPDRCGCKICGADSCDSQP